MAGRPTDSDHYALACEVGAAITSSLVLEDVLSTVAHRIAEAMGVWECDLYEYYAESQTIVSSATWSTDMTQDDIDNGRLICIIGIAPVKPAEFVIFRIAQWQGGSAATE